MWFETEAAQRAARLLGSATIVGSLVACAVAPVSAPAPIVTSGSVARPGAGGAPVATPRPTGAPPSGTVSLTGVAPGTVLPQPDPAGSGQLLRPKARWQPAQFTDLPGWPSDRLRDWWPALWRSCTKPQPGWLSVCTQVQKLGADWAQRTDDATVRQWVQAQFKPWRVTSADGNTSGLMTGYFEPMLDGRRLADERFQHPLHKAPMDLGQRKPHCTRAEVDTLPDCRVAFLGREIAYLADPLDVLLIQVQGSGRIRLQDDLDAQGRPRTVRLAFAGHNDQPYQSVARWLVDQGAFTLEQASWPAIRNWAQANPSRVPEMLRANPRVVYFKEEALPDPNAGPVGSQGVPLTPGRSIAVDKDSVPMGTPVWLDTTVPQAWAPTPPPAQALQRLVMAQDTGGAILGAVRADFFWGWGDEALAQAGRTKQPLAMWVLWPASR